MIRRMRLRRLRLLLARWAAPPLVWGPTCPLLQISLSSCASPDSGCASSGAPSSASSSSSASDGTL
eukprot:4200505-Heterocapsa_arctica.AAC.1